MLYELSKKPEYVYILLDIRISINIFIFVNLEIIEEDHLIYLEKMR